MKYKFTLTLILLLFISQIAYSKSNLEKFNMYPDEALTLEISIELALANNPQIDIAEAQLEFAEARLKQIITDFLPTISASYSRDLDLEEGEVNQETSINLSQSVFIDKGIVYAKHQAQNDVCVLCSYHISRIFPQKHRQDTNTNSSFCKLLSLHIPPFFQAS